MIVDMTSDLWARYYFHSKIATRLEADVARLGPGYFAIRLGQKPGFLTLLSQNVRYEMQPVRMPAGQWHIEVLTATGRKYFPSFRLLYDASMQWDYQVFLQ